MKSGFFNSLICVLLIMIVLPGIISGIASAVDEDSQDDGYSTDNAFSDLIVESISFSPASPASNERVTITAVVRNQGDAGSESTDLDFSIDGSSIGVSNVPAIEAGRSERIFLSNQVISKNEGTVQITAKVDSSNSVEESNEDDNEKTASLTFANSGSPSTSPTEFPSASPTESPTETPTETPTELPAGSSDLIVDTLTVPKTVKLGEKVSIRISVKNIGDQSSEVTKLVAYTGMDKKEWEIPKLDPASSNEVSYTWIPQLKGSTEIKAVVDEDNSVKESNEENNAKSATATVDENPLPDLIVENIVPEIPEPMVGKPVSFTVKVKNQGGADSKEVEAKYYVNGAGGNNLAVPAVPQGESKDVVFSLTPDKEGPMDIRVVVDSGTAVYEAREDNNELTKTVNVRAVLPDLKIDSLSLNPESPKPGENIAFTVTVKNNGPGDSSNNELRYEIIGTNETYSGKIPISALTAGSSATGTFSWTPKNEGKLEIKAKVDAGSVVSESDESNNEIAKTTTISNGTAPPGGGSSGGSSGGDSGSSGESSSSSSGSSGSSGDMGSGITSKEPVENIEVKELSTRHIISGYHVKFDFPEGVTCITYFEYDPKITFKRTTSIVEVLKNKSTFVPKPAPGKTYKNVNIWVGDEGAGLPEASENAFIEFKVEKKWIIDNNVSEPLITLQWYDEGWEPLYTEKVREDEGYVYFKAKAKGFSSFAITEYTEEDRSNAEGKIQETLNSWEKEGKANFLNGSAEREGLIKNPMGKAKMLMAISLPLFMLAVGYLVLKKKI